VRAIVEAGGRAVALQGDISTVAGVRKLFADLDHLLSRQGLEGLDILVNNAGVYPLGSLENTQEEDFDEIFNVNVRGLFFATQEAAKRMNRDGRVINISTTLTRVGSNSMIAYAASKGAVNLITRDSALALGARGITVNALSPGLTRTEGTSSMTSQPGIPEHFSGLTALGRLGEPADIADACALLASGDARWITGQCIEVSGGYRI
jgi:NAD(P)-dependent dehydrogenase (short-subunit alcohol dehydrogenase family)